MEYSDSMRKKQTHKTVAPQTSGTSLPKFTQKLCKKCEIFVKASNSVESIHSTLAYSRCRCHRLFKYRSRLPSSSKNAISKMSTPDPVSANVDRDDEDIPSAKNRSSKYPSVQTEHNLKQQGSSTAMDHYLPPIRENKTNILSCESGAQHVIGETSTVKSTKLPAISRKKGTGIHPKRVDELVDLWKFIPLPKRNMLKDLFKISDKNDDGHLSYAEFVGALPKEYILSGHNTLYKELHCCLSDATFFGFREFSLCYCVAEIICNCKINASSMESSAELVGDTLAQFMKYLSKSSIEGFVTMENIKEAALFMNLGFSFWVAEKYLKECGEKIPLLHCLALATFYLTRKKSTSRQSIKVL